MREFLMLAALVFALGAVVYAAVAPAVKDVWHHYFPGRNG